MNTTAIASHLNIVESAIAAVEEWANVLFVRFSSGRPRFVSKKVVSKMEKLDLATLDELPSLKNFDSYQAMMEWLKSNGLTFRDYEKELVRRRRIAYEAKKAQRNQAQQNQMVAPTVPTIFDKDKAFAATLGMTQTSTGEWVTADVWDEIEGDM